MPKLSELIREYVDLKIEGEPPELPQNEWYYELIDEYFDRLEELEVEIDKIVENCEPKHTRLGPA